MEQKEPFKVGDVVELRSGSVKMTVVEVYTTEVDCIFWVESTGVFDKKDFRKEWLTSVGK